MSDGNWQAYAGQVGNFDEVVVEETEFCQDP